MKPAKYSFLKDAKEAVRAVRSAGKFSYRMGTASAKFRDGLDMSGPYHFTGHALESRLFLTSAIIGYYETSLLPVYMAGRFLRNVIEKHAHNA